MMDEKSSNASDQSSNHPQGGEPVVVLFSGGRDSSAAVVCLAREQRELHLLSFQTGLVLNDLGLRSLRKRELQLADLPGVLGFRAIDVRPLVREIALVDLVDDIQQDGCQLVLLGEALCMFAAAVRFMKRSGIRHLAYGAAAYQAQYPEQTPAVIAALRSFVGRWGFDLITPGSSWTSDMHPKGILRRAGLSTKSLESISMFADIDDRPHSDVALDYIGRKMPKLIEYIELWP